VKHSVKKTVKRLDKTHRKAKLSGQLQVTNVELSQTKFALTREFISLARHQNDAVHLDDALTVLASMNKTHSMENAMYEHVDLQSEVAELFLSIGRQKNSRTLLEKAKKAYRTAITLASLTGDDAMRETLRQNYRITLSLLGDKPQSPSLFKVA